MNVTSLSGEQIADILPPHNLALALLTSGEWVKNEEEGRMELRAQANRLGEPCPFVFGWIDLELWNDEAEQDRVQVLRRKMVGEALERHGREEWTISTDRAQTAITEP